ncbi:MAG: CPBP family intramembrane metalloprotease [Kiritimatiellae bacterium]|nr:CPBP family intramembrane metalloprotease [Kiritimatiellia bacterium]
MLPSRYNLIHALAATAVLLTVVFWQGVAPFWQQFVYGLAVPMTPSVMLQTFLLTAALFGTLWLVLWASSLLAGLKSTDATADRMPLRAAVALAARWSPLIIAVALGLNWLCAAGIERFAGVEPSDQELVKCFTDSSTPLGFRLALGFLVLFEAPLFEEPLFRGVLFRGFAAALPVWAAMALSGVLFAIVHVNAASFLALCFLGCAFAELYRRTGTILAPMTAHALFNAANLALLPFVAP